ncbi:hypothetical protein CRUP_008500 [Coryphaenoides rupestris]|nr:hypothetical protein CRUP_008500 [Coryphaenoides rupestris]
MDDLGDLVRSAGRAVLDMVEREWEPLSPGELEQRLDQTVEDLLEADLVARVQAQPAPPPHAPPPAPPMHHHVHLQVQVQQAPKEESPLVLSAETMKPASHNEEEEEELGHLGQDTGGGEDGDTVDSYAVKHITDLLQSATSHRSRSRLAGRARISLPQTVLLSLTLLSRRLSYRAVSGRFRLEKGNIHRIFSSFCDRVNLLQDESGPEEAQGAPQVLGVLGHTRIPIRLPTGTTTTKQSAEQSASMPEVKRMRRETAAAHPDSWLNLELVCDRRGRFLHCHVSRGSETDRAALLRGRLGRESHAMPPGSCLVARAGYPLTEHILTPHVPSCRGGVGPREGLYNKTLEAYFGILDQAVGSLKARFQRLHYLDMGNYARARAVVLTACVLHNVFLDFGPLLQGEADDVTEEEEAAGAVVVEEDEGEVDEDGLRRREAIMDLFAFCCAHMFIFLSCSSMYSCRTLWGSGVVVVGTAAGTPAGTAGKRAAKTGPATDAADADTDTDAGSMGVNLLLAMALPSLVPLSRARRWASTSSWLLPSTSCMAL